MTCWLCQVISAGKKALWRTLSAMHVSGQDAGCVARQKGTGPWNLPSTQALLSCVPTWADCVCISVAAVSHLLLTQTS